MSAQAKGGGGDGSRGEGGGVDDDEIGKQEEIDILNSL